MMDGAGPMGAGKPLSKTIFRALGYVFGAAFGIIWLSIGSWSVKVGNWLGIPASEVRSWVSTGFFALVLTVLAWSFLSRLFGFSPRPGGRGGAVETAEEHAARMAAFELGTWISAGLLVLLFLIADTPLDSTSLPLASSLSDLTEKRVQMETLFRNQNKSCNCMSFI
jgi:hypothetical protein